MIEPFVFQGCHGIRESLGVSAGTERALLERLRTIPQPSIFHHSVRCLLRQPEGPMMYFDDFARWAANAAGDPELAERLALFTPFDFATIEEFRDHLVATLEDHLATAHPARHRAREPFRFLRSHLATVPLGLEVDDLATLRAGIAAVDDSAIYFHAVESPGRQGLKRNDFATWVETQLRLPELAAALAAVDPFVTGLARTRALLTASLDATLPRALA